MTTHVVVEGDTLARIARLHGFLRWETVWDDEGNVELRRNRSNPRLLAVGDAVAIPKHRAREASCATGSHHAFVAHRAETTLQLRLLDSDDAPVSGWNFQIDLGARRLKGMIPASGVLSLSVPLNLKEAMLRVSPPNEPLQSPRGFSSRLRIGFLQPGELDQGALARLHNLGYYDPAASEPVDAPQRDRGTRQFRASQHIQASPQAARSTYKKLAEIYGC